MSGLTNEQIDRALRVPELLDPVTREALGLARCVADLTADDCDAAIESIDAGGCPARTEPHTGCSIEASDGSLPGCSTCRSDFRVMDALQALANLKRKAGR